VCHRSSQIAIYRHHHVTVIDEGLPEARRQLFNGGVFAPLHHLNDAVRLCPFTLS
jgi:hypothetical protein